jgi:serine/threonine protein phosphatase PrpC
VLATDGVWDVLDNDAVCALVAAIADPSAAAKAIASRTRVLMKELRIRIDDITVLVVDVHGYSNTCPPPRSQVIHAASCNPGCVMM